MKNQPSRRRIGTSEFWMFLLCIALYETTDIPTNTMQISYRTFDTCLWRYHQRQHLMSGDSGGNTAWSTEKNVLDSGRDIWIQESVW